MSSSKTVLPLIYFFSSYNLFYSGFYADLVKEDKTLLSLGSMFVILDKIIKKEVIIYCLGLGGRGGVVFL